MNVQSVRDHGIYEPPQKAQEAQRKESVPAAVPEPDRISEGPAYEVVPGEKPEPVGLYRLAHDGGAPRLELDAPGKADKSGPAAPETCTVNTDRADREVARLKADRKQLERQVRAASDPAKAKELERRLAQVEGELRQKDNDGYRRGNADVT